MLGSVPLLETFSYVDFVTFKLVSEAITSTVDYEQVYHGDSFALTLLFVPSGDATYARASARLWQLHTYAAVSVPCR
jgi:hypothetical protein